MSQPTDSLDAVDLKAVAAGGLVREDVLDTIYGMDERGTPFLDAVGTGSFSNNYSEWFEEALLTANSANKFSSGTDYAPATSATGARVGNHGQISRRGVNVTDRAQDLDKVGRSDELGYQTAREIQGLRYDVEAIAIGRQASVADNPGTTVGTTAGLDAWLATNTSNGATAGADGGFNTSTKVVAAPTAGDKRALTWLLVTNQIEACYLLGSRPTMLMSTPAMTKRIGHFLVDTKKVQYVANIDGEKEATLVSNQYVDMFKTDFGYSMTIVPNLHQAVYTAGDTGDVVTVFGIDPRFIQVCDLYGVRVTPLARTGDFVRKMVQRDWMTKMLLERAHFAIRDVIPTTAVAAT